MTDYNIEVTATDTEKAIISKQLTDEMVLAGYANVTACSVYGSGKVIVHSTGNYAVNDLKVVIDAHTAAAARDWATEYAMAIDTAAKLAVVAEKLGLV